MSRPPPPTVRRTAAFTFVEMLLVVVIVVVLFFIFMPASQKARDKGKRAGCMSNLRQIGMALNLYAEDRDGTYPSCPARPSEEPKKIPLRVVLQNYLKAPECFCCPADPDENYFRHESSSYEWNAKNYNGWKPDHKLPAAKLKKLPPILFDFAPFHGPADKKDSRNYLYPFSEITAGPR